MIMCLLVSGIIIFGQYFITNIYLTAEYKDAYLTTLFLIIPAMVPLIQNLGIEIQRAMNKHQFRSIIYIVMAVINVILSIPLAMHFGPVGSAMGINVLEFWKNIIQLAKGLLIPAILGFAIMYTGFVDSVWKFILGVMIYIIVYAISFWLVGMNVSEKELAKGFVHRMTRRHND